MIERGTPLRPGDPELIGPYRVSARLGAGGMGVVFLAHDPGGRPVAVKVVHAEMATDEEFRKRFRSEVARVRQVPPFCTAEVLDADPDAPRPYLVTEFVDGPSLADEVARRGPLSASNLHAVAIGVATALTAIHGAGVIHRDLKPHNVLLAPGTPKVIDFGIARAWESTTQHTRTGQIVGTANYMAPERFDESGGPLTAAADVFAWGCVVAFAGTGRPPFHADSPMAVFGRILTQAPDLGGLDGPLRALVERALDRDPARRPTARDLLDALIGGGAARSPQLADALETQPALRTAAIEMRENPGPAFTLPTETPPESLFGPAPASPFPAPVPSGPPGSPPPYGPVSGPPYGPAPVSPVGVGYPHDEDRTLAMHPSPGFAAGPGVPAGPGMPPGYGYPPGPPVPAAPVRRAGGGGRLLVGALVVLLAIAVVGGGGLLAAHTAGAFGAAAGDELDAEAETPDVPAEDTPPALTVPPGSPVVTDALTEGGQWHGTYIVDEEESNCDVRDGALRAQRITPGKYICAGPETPIEGDHTVSVTARLEKPGTCLGVWLYWEIPRSYRLTACETAFRIEVDREDGTGRLLREVPLETPLPLDEPLRLQVVVENDTVRFGHDGVLVAESPLPEPDITAGRAAAVGLVSAPGDETPPYGASFTDIEVDSLGD
ncbi:serine/threonine-protein kinase [Catenuloplanes atrovinosus]|uniref:Serine/threonine protein kinase n=1 Tax=Catenuloplanes atrovinosus TaxID=137266 RepID=A0AAE3YN63_9ACTN|nr:serine/threonine-protein kinase [Catenuloplanes atrovinosus]MDR7276127.1 serine/threonine protein kinase [Catenuloplanes atrovinosus]